LGILNGEAVFAKIRYPPAGIETLGYVYDVKSHEKIAPDNVISPRNAPSPTLKISIHSSSGVLSSSSSHHQSFISFLVH
jgi:hypothetical protein